ncbi:hypothetical protein HDU96_001737 [Phlyctochytrium bullatum]|nr:hypothetical protein HDU96_001737 [Phlyctochytrium bullatum]
MLLGKLLAVAAIVAGAAAAGTIKGANSARKIPNAYALEFPADVDAEAALKSYFSAKGITDYKIRTRIKNPYYNGISFNIGEKHDEELITAIPGAKDVYHVHNVPRPTPAKVSSTDSLKFPPEAIHSITGVNDARNKLGLTGKGIKVAVIDTGVAYDHPALGGAFGPGHKVSFGYDLVGDDYDGYDPATIKPDSDPLDECSASSHGTHVAGIVGADATNVTDPEWATPIPFTGVAPGATLGAYRVFSCSAENTSTDILAQAIYLAAKDGADIINLSIGGGPAFADSIDAVAATRVSADKHFVFASNGNDGAVGLYAGGTPAAAVSGFGVASFDNVAVPAPYLTVVNAQSDFQYSAGQLNANFEFDKEYEIVVNDLTADDLDKQDDGSAATPTVSARGKALLIRWGDTTFGGSVRRCNYAYRAGAVACIIYSNTVTIPGIFGSADIPSLATDRKAGQAIIAAVKAGQTAKLLVSQKLRNFALATAGTVSDFSSPGLDQELNIKPDFGGIGGEVYSTISKFASGGAAPYAIYSGTSMSSPYTAGVAALILESYGSAKPTFEELRTKLQNAAVPQKKFGYDAIDSVAYQGAGLLNAYNAATGKTTVFPSRLALNDTKNTKQHYPITVTNKNTVSIDYSVTHIPALTVTPFAAGDDATLTAADASYTKEPATVLFSRNNDRVPVLNFTLAPGASKSFNVHVQPPSTAIAGLFPVYSGYVVVNEKSASGFEGKLASVPYAGVVGAWRDAPVWSRKSANYDSFIPAASFLLGVDPAPNATLSTGLYQYSSGFAPLKTNDSVSISDGAIILPFAATTSRLARVEAIYKGKEWSKLSSLGIKRETRLIVFPDIGASVGSLSLVNPYPLYFETIQRTSYVQGQSVVTPNLWLWTGSVITNITDPAAQAVQLPFGKYQLRFTALKHFGRVGSPIGGTDWDTVLTPEFNLVP